MDKNYDSKTVEKKWQDFWEKEGVYKFERNSDRPIFSIDTPPPYISSDSLHTGHAMSYVQAEIIIRYHRMKGENIFYPMGFDDNGLPTERFVEKKYKINKAKITRQEFVELCLKETKEGGKNYEKIWRSLGLGVDWSLLYSTISPLAQKISQRSFLDLYRKGRIYQAEKPTLWCTTCQTALAQADLDVEEKDSQLVYIRAGLETGEEIVFATTRPELLPACMGISVHPEDERYKKLIGKKVTMPLTGKTVVLSADEATEKEFGSGVVYYCSFGGNECVEWLSRHPEAEPIELILPNGRFSQNGGEYQGMKVLDARKRIIDDLKKAGAIEKIEPIKHAVFVHERCKTEVEYRQTKQWFIKIMDIKEDIRKRGEEVKWYPKFMKAHLDNWINGLKWDWCISRDRFFGVPFPVWFCEDCGEIILPEDSELPVDPRENLPRNKKCPKCQSQKIKGENQVLDTWATSSSTPLINSHWGEKDNLEEKIYPMSLRVQGFEIIRTWLFYTLVKSHLNTNSIPWENVMISGWGLAANGEKMSKSLNNFVTAESMIEKYSADALRFWSCGATLGMNLRFNEEDIRAGQKLLTKFWNLARFVEISSKGKMVEDFPREKLAMADKWILAELQELVQEVTKHFEVYEFAKARVSLEHFFWIKFADNYVELVKGRLYGEDEEKRNSAVYTLHKVLENLVKLFAPIIPHITEELYQNYLRKENDPVSVHLSQWPKADSSFKNDELLESGKELLKIIYEIRKQKSDKKIKLADPVKELVLELKDKNISAMGEDLKNVARSEEVEIIEGKENKVQLK